ncbi:N(G),N(G)-dimethylarginine dimethylaminohydrolase 1 [Thoreauomyces humboldtii]|nr:N(G),N(G)-dimethylarginine dimethylaminohydrolase 1 [Thoreauomyces humboldtii]
MVSAFIRAGVPTSYATSCITDVDVASAPIELLKAQEQHSAYVAALSKVVPIIPLPLDEGPDSVFVEDTVVLVGDTAVLTRPGAPSRRGEVDSMEATLKAAIESGRTGQTKKVVRMMGTATLDGGDCLNTGRMVIVGLSARTNAEGVKFLSDATMHTGIPVHGVAGPAALHLKCVVSMLCTDTILYVDNPSGRLVRDFIESHANGHAYSFVAVPEQIPSNVLSVPGDEPGTVKLLFVQAGFPDSEKIIRKAMRDRGQEDKLQLLDMSEIIKGDGALTCMSVIVI